MYACLSLYPKYACKCKTVDTALLNLLTAMVRGVDQFKILPHIEKSQTWNRPINILSLAATMLLDLCKYYQLKIAI